MLVCVSEGCVCEGPADEQLCSSVSSSSSSPSVSPLSEIVPRNIPKKFRRARGRLGVSDCVVMGADEVEEEGE